MKNIDNLKRLKSKLMLLTYLTSLGVGIIGSNIHVNATENAEIVEQEETEVSNEDNKCETYEEKITYYSNVYGVKEQYVHDYMDYMLYENPDNQEFLNMNLDLQIIRAAQHVYNSPDYSKEEVRTGKTYKVTLYPEELIEKYSEIRGIDKRIPLSISCTECKEPIQTDWNYRTNGNPAGIGGDMYLGNAEMGVIYFIDMLCDNYGVDKNTGPEVFERIAKTYCPPNWQFWTGMTNDIYSEIENDYFARASKDVKAKYNVEEKDGKKIYTLKKLSKEYYYHYKK